MTKTFEQHKLRTWLDRPISKRSKWSCLSICLLFPLSLLWGCIAKFRRIYLKKVPSKISSHDIPIICVGNIMVGGTGKSPVVVNIANSFLNQNYCIAIVSRGVGKYLPKFVKCQGGFSSVGLSDENLEMYEILRLHKNFSNVFWLQGSDRVSSIKIWQDSIESDASKKTLQKIILLDDGLQNFKIAKKPTDMDVCVWQKQALAHKYFFCLPLGPFREGFPETSKTLLNTFPVRIWSRFWGESTADFFLKSRQYIKEISRDLNLRNITLDRNKDFFVGAFYNFSIPTNEGELENVTRNQVIQIIKAKKISRAHSPTGIANPMPFWTALNDLFEGLDWKHWMGPDHGELPKKIFAQTINSDIVFFTLKDFCRWKKHYVENHTHDKSDDYDSSNTKKPLLIVVTLCTQIMNSEARSIDFFKIWSTFLKQESTKLSPILSEG